MERLLITFYVLVFITFYVLVFIILSFPLFPCTIQSMSSGFHAPFRHLKKTLKLSESRPAPAKPAPPPPPQAREDDQTEEDLFWQEMQNVAPLKKDGHRRVSGPPPAL